MENILRTVTLTALLLVVVWGAVAYQLSYDRNTVITASQLNSRNLARAYAEHVLGTLNLLDQTLRRVQSSYAQEPSRFDLQQQLRDSFRITDGAVVLGVTDRQGKLLASSGAGSSRAVYLGDRDYFLAQVNNDSGQTFVSKPIVGRISGRSKIIVLSRRLTDRSGAFAGIAFVSFDPAYLSGFFSDLALANDRTFAIVGSDMIVRDLIEASGRQIDLIGRSVANSALRAALASAPNGEYEAVSALDGVLRFVTYRSLPDYQLVVVASVPQSDVLANYRMRRLWIVGIAAVLSLLTVGAAAFQFRWVRLRWRADAELRQAQERIVASQRESEERFRALIELSNDMVCVVDCDLIVTYRSQSSTAQLGVTGAEVVGRSILDRVHPNDRAELERALRQCAAAPDRRAEGRVHVRHRDGSWRTLAYAARNALDIPGVKGIIINSRDITEILKLAEGLNKAQKMEAIGKLTGGMAHDFNNYLGVIIGNLDLVRTKNAFDSEAIEMIDDALHGAMRGAELTRSLLAFSRQQPLAPRRVELGPGLVSVTTLVKRTIGEDITLQTVFAPDLWPVRVDLAQLDSCIVNLANNARDAMPHGGTLTVAARNVALDAAYAQANPGVVPGEYVLIEIADTGAGMAPAVLAHVFEPFFTTKPEGQGTGLGLSMVYGFVKQSGGHVTIDSEVGHGTAVRIYLPHDLEAENEAAAIGHSPATVPRRATETILVVEDKAIMRKTVVGQLRSLGYRTIEAENGAAALAILAQAEPPIDLLFTDIVMPGDLDGYALAKRAEDLRPGIKIVLTSGFPGTAPQREDAAALGLFLLSKPYRLDDVTRAIRAALSPAPEFS